MACDDDKKDRENRKKRALSSALSEGAFEPFAIMGTHADHKAYLFSYERAHDSISIFRDIHLRTFLSRSMLLLVRDTRHFVVLLLPAVLDLRKANASSAREKGSNKNSNTHNDVHASGRMYVDICVCVCVCMCYSLTRVHYDE